MRNSRKEEGEVLQRRKDTSEREGDCAGEHTGAAVCNAVLVAPREGVEPLGERAAEAAVLFYFKSMAPYVKSQVANSLPR
eukprot:1769417-Rhodomonas_salina.1